MKGKLYIRLNVWREETTWDNCVWLEDDTKLCLKEMGCEKGEAD